jgi:nucleoside-diphosphate-sugar epimerase
VSLAEHADRSAVGGKFFNVSGRRYETLDEIATSVAREYGFKDGVQFIAVSAAEPSFPAGLHFVFSFSQWVGSERLRSVTGWKDKRALFSEAIHVHRLAFEAFKSRGNANVAEIQRRIGGNFNAPR